MLSEPFEAGERIACLARNPSAIRRVPSFVRSGGVPFQDHAVHRKRERVMHPG